MKLIVGLGNPGPEYDRTRHNVGFMAVDMLCARHAPGQLPRSRFGGLAVEAQVSPRGGGDRPERCLLLKPMTYMNRSGRCVSEAVHFYKLDPAADLFVIVDDIYLPTGAIRIRASGGAGGHNGLEDVQRALGTEGYARCRIGVDRPAFADQADWVLGRLSEQEMALVGPAIEKACDAAETWATCGVDAAMNRFNQRIRAEGEGAPGAVPDA